MAGGSLAETRYYYYTDDWQDVEERLGTSPDTTNPDRQFVWGVQYIDDLICRDRSVAATLDERLYACQDANWNVTAVVDTSGDVAERYEYDPYGATTVMSDDFVAQEASAYDWETTYAGYRWDSGTLQYAVRNRFYQPQVGRWLTRDPLSSSTVSAYEFVQSKSVSRVDPTGLKDESPTGAFFSSIGSSLYSVGQFYYSLGQYVWGNSEGAAKTMDSANVNSSLGQAEQIGPGTYNATAGSLMIGGSAAVAAGSLVAMPAIAAGETAVINGITSTTFGVNTVQVAANPYTWAAAGGAYGAYTSGGDPGATLQGTASGMLLNPNGISQLSGDICRIPGSLSNSMALQPPTRQLQLPDRFRSNLLPPITFQRGTHYYDAVSTAANQQIDMDALARHQAGRAYSYDFGPGLYAGPPGSPAPRFWASTQGQWGALYNIRMPAAAFDTLRSRFPATQFNVPQSGSAPGCQTFFPPESLPMLNRWSTFTYQQFP